MLKILRYLIYGGCIHKWAIIETATVRYNTERQFLRYHLECKKCGNIKVTEGRK